ncbi:MAG: DUF2953 domain-containing protein [Gammaproteobacteria bacterium]|jgi:hypothetical protein
MLTAVALSLLVVFLLLAIPVGIQFRVSRHKTFDAEVHLEWLFGLMKLRLQPPGSKSTSREGKSRSSDDKASSTAAKKSIPVALVRQKHLRRRIFRFIGDLWHAIHKEKLSLNMRIGLGDPAETGQLWALLGPLAALLSTMREVTIGIRPDFIETCFELDCSGKIRVIPLHLIGLVALLLLSPSIWRGIGQMRQRAA